MSVNSVISGVSIYFIIVEISENWDVLSIITVVTDTTILLI